MAAGLAVVIAGIWVIAQVIAGGALDDEHLGLLSGLGGSG